MTEHAASENLANELYDELCELSDQEWRRDCPRRETHEALDLEYPGEDGIVRVTTAYAINVSYNALGITCRQEFRQRDRIRIRRAFGEKWTNAQVVHCTPTVGGFKIGVRII